MSVNHTITALVSQNMILNANEYCSDRPICLTDQKMIYGVSEQETAHISCTVDSNPKVIIHQLYLTNIIIKIMIMMIILMIIAITRCIGRQFLLDFKQHRRPR